jgi:Fe-S oxidoreductase
MTPATDLALRLCTYCPKMCRFSCPVSEASGRETVTPWGKMSALKRGEESPGAEAALAYACTGCLRCQRYCAHGVDVPEALFPGREGALSRGEAPEGAKSAVRSFAQREAALAGLVSGWPAGPVGFHPGCGALAARHLAEDARAVLEKLAPGEVGAAAAGRPPCCGYPLYAAGALPEFRAHARSVAARLTGPLVVLDPGCAFTFKALYPRHGAALPAGVETLPELVARRLPAAPRAKAVRPRYHDACHLGRGLGVYEAPRRALAWAAGAPPAELALSGDDALCSGGGGLLPKTDPETAAQIARDAAALAAESAEGGPIVTACPGARKMLAGAGAEAVDFVSFIRKALE